MGTRRPISKSTSFDQPSTDRGSEQSISLEGSAARHLLTRIADVLQVPSSALYPPSAGEPSEQSKSAIVEPMAGEVDDQCMALLRSYRRIIDPEERRRILALTEQAAERA